MVAATDLIGIALLLFVAFVAVLVLFFDALSKVLLGAVAALARAPWRGGQMLLTWVRDEPEASPSERRKGQPAPSGDDRASGTAPSSAAS